MGAHGHFSTLAKKDITMAEKAKAVPVTRIKRLAEGQAPMFTLPVEFKRLDGNPVQVDLQCKALRKTVWSKLRDDVQRAALQAVKVSAPEPEAAPDAPADPAPAEASAGTPADVDLLDTAAPAAAPPAPAPAPANALDFIERAMERITERGIEAGVRKNLADDAALILNFATGWDLEDDFTADSLADMEDQFSGFLGAALNAYDRAIYQGRVGN